MNQKRKVGGGGLLNKIIDRLPWELHLPNYQYCGPGTQLEKRLKLGQTGINKLDEACRKHDIVYSQSKDADTRRVADQVLEEEAWTRVRANDSNWKEKIFALGVTAAMKAKRKMGAGGKTRRKGVGKRKKRSTSLRKGMALARKALAGSKSSSLYEQTMLALKAAKSGVRRRKRMYPRVIPVPKKKGGILPFLMAAVPALAALGSVVGGTASLVKTINEGKKASQELQEKIRHNKKIEELALGKGLYLKPWRGGLGLYVKSKN